MPIDSISEVNITLRLDTIERLRGERSRLFFVVGDKEVETTTHLLTLKLNKLNCFKHHKALVRVSCMSRLTQKRYKAFLLYNLSQSMATFLNFSLSIMGPPRFCSLPHSLRLVGLLKGTRSLITYIMQMIFNFIKMCL